MFLVTFTFGNMWRYYLPCSRFQSDSLTLGWVTCCLRIEIAVVTLWISVASTISASPSTPSFNASLPCSISTAANMSQVWLQTHSSFFCKVQTTLRVVENLGGRVFSTTESFSTIAHTAAFKLGGLFDILTLFSISMVNQ